MRDANSKPITPPPMIASDCGNSSNFNISSLDNTMSPSNGKNGNDIGLDPVQISTLLFGINSDSPSSYSTETVPLCGEKIEGPKMRDRKSTRLNSSHVSISYAVFCLKK